MSCLERGYCVIRVNANPQLGNGHLMRCLTIARLAQKNLLTPIFVLSDVPGVPLSFIQAAGFGYILLPVAGHVQDAELFCGYIADLKRPCWVVVDVYAFSAPWHKIVYPRCCQLLVIDDLANRAYFCDSLLDHTPGRIEADYHPWVNASAQLYLGEQHALLAPEFFAAVSDARRIREEYFSQKYLPRLLVSLGGTDPNNYSLLWFDLLVNHAAEFNGITFLLASNAAVVSQLADKIACHDQALGFIQLIVNAHDIPQLIMAHDLALGGAGVSALERAVLGLPSAMLTLADNQVVQAQALHQFGCAVNLGDWQKMPLSQRQQNTLEQLMQLKNNYTQCRAMSERAFCLVPQSQNPQQHYPALTDFFNTSRAGVEP